MNVITEAHTLLLETQYQRAASLRQRWTNSNRQVDDTHNREDHWALLLVTMTDLTVSTQNLHSVDERLALNQMVLVALEH